MVDISTVSVVNIDISIVSVVALRFQAGMPPSSSAGRSWFWFSFEAFDGCTVSLFVWWPSCPSLWWPGVRRVTPGSGEALAFNFVLLNVGGLPSLRVIYF